MSAGNHHMRNLIDREKQHVDERLPIYAETEKRIGYGAITLVRRGEYACVDIEHRGRSIEVIREHVEGNFCHSITALGIAEEIEGREGCDARLYPGEVTPMSKTETLLSGLTFASILISGGIGELAGFAWSLISMGLFLMLLIIPVGALMSVPPNEKEKFDARLEKLLQKHGPPPASTPER